MCRSILEKWKYNFMKWKETRLVNKIERKKKELEEAKSQLKRVEDKLAHHDYHSYLCYERTSDINLSRKLTDKIISLQTEIRSLEEHMTVIHVSVW